MWYLVLETITTIIVFAMIIGGLLAIPFGAAKLTNLEKGRNNRWSIFWRHISKDIAAGKVALLSPFLGWFVYYGFYQFVKVGDDSSAILAIVSCAAIGLFLVFHMGLLDRKFFDFHLDNMKLLAVSLMSLILVALNVSFWFTTFIGAIATMICAIKYSVEQIILEAERARAREEGKSRKI
ncbi:hypothetical protein P3339_12505 [Microbulbifer sp. MLAF003]|uniref:hypothetical protein n=1 Tax=unclassified Microbulbifer TaxID=2619833 RepID=UPI0024AC83ED|nr:hypothetical protein [Microbulbifer sp. MLAF003]WHI49306.1 hypothetical protein P3339_12505 [Microbulbifer sp. MLAF003]